MNNHLFPLIILHSIVTIFCILIVLPASHCRSDEQFLACSSPYSYSCGSRILNISYPFWGGSRPQYCGRKGFELRCQDNQYHVIESASQIFRVLNIDDSNQTMIIARDDIWNSSCPGQVAVLQNTIFNTSLFKCGPTVRNLSLFYDCQETIQPLFYYENNYFNCSVDGVERTGFFTVEGSEFQSHPDTDECKAGIKVPVLTTVLQDPGNLGEIFNRGFEVEYDADYIPCAACKSSYVHGACGSKNSNSEEFTCHQRPGNERVRNVSMKVKIGIIMFAVCGIMVTFIIICIFKRRKTVMFWKITKKDRDLEAFIRNYGSLAPKRYSFSNVKKMTNSFKDKLGQGGYGGVYKGKLKDGQLIAVKLLNTSKGNGQDFINEVGSISRTSHVNVVTLLGFCLEGSKRALIYEFMPNGSLEKFIHGNDTLKTNQHLGWEKLYQIALGIARGLEYLHRGCNTRILHFDIKPHNILLDESFCPKISDFGLAKLCPKNKSIVSMLEARGTIGYIAPEVISRNFGEVSHKSDVYSYGMMVLEMVGGRKNLHLGVENSSEIYFPKWVYKHLEVGEEIKLCDAMSREENEIVKKMIIVGLWCIQTPPLERPSMNKVIDMLQGSIEALQIPPNPFHSSSPPRSTLTDSSTIPMP